MEKLIQPRGVTLLPNGKWTSRLFVDGKLIHLGCFKEMDDAREAYVTACHEYGKEHLIERKAIPASKATLRKRRKKMEKAEAKKAEQSVESLSFAETIDKLKQVQNDLFERIEILTERINKLES